MPIFCLGRNNNGPCSIHKIKKTATIDCDGFKSKNMLIFYLPASTSFNALCNFHALLIGLSFF